MRTVLQGLFVVAGMAFVAGMHVAVARAGGEKLAITLDCIFTFCLGWWAQRIGRQ